MSPHDASLLILMADDDEEDCELATEAFRQGAEETRLAFVADGEELLAYLGRCFDGEGDDVPERPDLILLDLNMPRLDGREALAAIKRDPRMRSIPVVMFTTSGAETDVQSCYAEGAASFVTKPRSFTAFVEIAASLVHYWTRVVRLPGRETTR